MRVLEVAGGVGVAYAAKLFADLGADVVRLEPAGGDAAAGDATEDGSGDRAPIVDVVRRRPHGVHRWLNTNKRSIVGRVEELSATADIVLHDLGPAAAAAAAGLAFDRLMADNAALVVCAITPFGPSGPYADFAAAHLGADLIKLESVDRLCMFRRLPYSPTGVPLDHDTAGVFHLYNSDKRSVGIDLGQSSSRQIVERLVAVSDVVVDNFGVGTMARLGFGPDDLRRINPNVIVASLSGYGQTGPAASYMAYGPAGGAILRPLCGQRLRRRDAGRDGYLDRRPGHRNRRGVGRDGRTHGAPFATARWPPLTSPWWRPWRPRSANCGWNGR